jgi:hypothetical protein
VRLRQAPHRIVPGGRPLRGGGYGPNLQAFAVYFMGVHFVPAQRCVELLGSLTGAAPSVGGVHGMLHRASTLLAEVDERIRALITVAYAVCCDETPLRVGPRAPKPDRKKADKYLLVACTKSCSPTTCSATAKSRRQSRAQGPDRLGGGCTTATTSTTRPRSADWCISCAASISCVILSVLLRSTPTRTGPTRSPRRCAA